MHPNPLNSIVWAKHSDIKKAFEQFHAFQLMMILDRLHQPSSKMPFLPYELSAMIGQHVLLPAQGALRALDKQSQQMQALYDFIDMSFSDDMFQIYQENIRYADMVAILQPVMDAKWALKKAMDDQSLSFEQKQQIAQQAYDQVKIQPTILRDDQSVLTRLAVVGMHGMITAFVTAGYVNVNEPDANGDTALHAAVAAHVQREPSDQLETAQALLALGADPTIKDKQGRIPRHYVNDTGIINVLKEAEEQVSAGRAASTGAPVILSAVRAEQPAPAAERTCRLL